MQQKLEIMTQLERVKNSLDTKENTIKTMEHFIDKYIPIRIQQQLGETLQAVLGRTQLQKLENFEMTKYKRLNEDVLDDESHPELIDLCKKLYADLTGVVEQFKRLAKQRGFKYEIKDPKS